MKANKLFYFELISIFFIFILGSILHFTYNWSNNNKLVAIASSINESTWEHLKILFIPMLISTIIGYILFNKKYNNYLCSKTKGIITGLSFIVIFFYTYTGILGTNYPIIDISSFFLAGALGQYKSYKNIINNKPCNNAAALIILITLLLMFIIFTFYQPNIGIFIPPNK